LFLVAFLWSVKTGQYNDEMSPPMRMLLDSVPAKESSEPAKNDSL
jgi:cbb3-type cytochrome oxidase maturation protein